MNTGRVFVTLDNLGRALEVGAGRAFRPDPDEPGLRFGVPRLLALLDELAIRATFFVEGWNGLHHPDVLTSIVDSGHEIGLHGWVHERWAELDTGERERLLHDGTAALRSTGITPRGFRAPGGYRGTGTAGFLRELGYTYDSSIDAETENDPLRVSRLPEGIVTIPWHWEMIDYYQYEMHPEGSRTPQQLVHRWMKVLDQTADTGGLATLILHPFVSGVDPTRFAAVRKILTYAVTHPRLVTAHSGQLIDAVQ